MTLELEWQKAEQERQEDTHQHEPPEVEFGFYNQVQQGDVDAVQENLRSGLYRQIAMRVRLSDDLVQNFRSHCIICLSMVSRFCIEGGMPGEQAYRMSDFYIRKIDTATTIDQVEKLHDDACMDYAKRMQQRKIKQVCSKPVSLCLNYIYSHMHEKISTEELAAEVHLHPSYLSRLFQIKRFSLPNACCNFPTAATLKLQTCWRFLPRAISYRSFPEKSVLRRSSFGRRNFVQN